MTRKERRKMMRERRRENLKLTDKKHPQDAIIATLLAVLSIVILVTACMHSSERNGKSGIGIGFAGMGAGIISAIGFVMAAKSLKRDDIRYLFPSIASVANGLLLIFYVFIYFWGLYV